MGDSIVWWIPAFFFGLLLGVIYFGGLWASVQHLLVFEAASLLFLLSFVIRSLIVLAGFYWVMDGYWERLIAAGAGFLMVRMVMTQQVRRELNSEVWRKKEAE